MFDVAGDVCGIHESERAPRLQVAGLLKNGEAGAALKLLTRVAAPRVVSIDGDDAHQIHGTFVIQGIHVIVADI